MSLQIDSKDRSWLAVCGLALFVVGLMAWWVPTGPRKQYLDSKAALAGAKEELELSQLLKLEEEMRVASERPILERLRTRPATFNFFTLIDQTLSEAKLKERAELNKVRVSNEDSPQELLELRLNGVTLEELVDFLHRVYEKQSLVAVYQMNYLRPGRDGKGLECNITFATIKPGVYAGG